MTEPNFLENFFCGIFILWHYFFCGIFFVATLFCGIPQFNGLKMDKNQVFLNLLKDFGSNFLWVFVIMKTYIFLHKSRIWGNFYSWDIDQNVLRQPDCRIFYSTISLEQINKIAWFFCILIQVHIIKSWSKNFWVGMTGQGQSGHVTLRFTVSQEWRERMNWYFACWYKFRKAKGYFNNFCVGVFKNGHGYLVHETLKSALSKE